MLTRRLELAARILFVIAGLFFTAAFILRVLFVPSPNPPFLEKKEPESLPVFWKTSEKGTLEEPFLALDFSPAAPRLPDLRRVLLYFGKNSRPDANQNDPTLFFGLAQDRHPIEVIAKQPRYLKYDKTKVPPQYVFSEKNMPTNLWFTATPKPSPSTLVLGTGTSSSQAEILVYMKDELGRTIEEPAFNHEFTLPEQDLMRYGVGSGFHWEIGSFRVDGTLLVRQKARWYGSDKFLERHGGEEYEEILSKQRIDFGDGPESYSVFVGVGDALVWDKRNDKERWWPVVPGPESLGKSLLVVKKIEERLMLLELFAPEGKAKILLNLVKSVEMWNQQNLEKTFRFLGAKTKSQFVFEINKKRFVLSPHDWLLYVNGKWKKLETASDIDAYVDRETVGILFVFDGMEISGDRWILKGVMFNPSRTAVQEIELPIGDAKGVPKTKAEAPESSKEAKAMSSDDEDEDDDGLDDDDEDYDDESYDDE